MSKRFSKAKGVTFRIALTGLCSSMLVSVQVVLASIPNMEGVTILTALFGYCFGIYGVFSSLIFCFLEMLIYGGGYISWIAAYFLYWPMLAAIFWILGRKRVRNRLILTLTALLCTVYFGVLTSLIDTGVFTGNSERFFYRFWIIYSRGVSFYVVQILTNAFLFPILFRPLSDVLARINVRFMQTGEPDPPADSGTSL